MVKDEVGNIYGLLRVVARRENNKRNQATWECHCACGSVVVRDGANLRKGHIKSCGCYRRSGDYVRKHGHASYLKGVSGTYKSWQEMRNRCYVPSHVSYKNYGAIGVTVCDRWKDSFENFLADMGERPTGTSIDRIDCSIGYEPSNCRWSDRKTQNRNKRGLTAIEYRGETRCLSDWCERLSLPYNRTYYRLFVAKMPVEAAFDREVKMNGNKR